MIRVKICCMASIEEARTAVAAGANALGLVGRMPSGPGPIPDELIAEIAATVPPGVATFLLTSETEPEAVVEHVRRSGANTVQLVDRVSGQTYAALRRALPLVKLVQVVHVADHEALSEAVQAAPHVDALLLDSGSFRGPVKELGGTGRVHDWEVSRRIVETAGRPVYLAGGLKPENVTEAIRQVRPFGVDLCTGVRTDGRLDPVKLHAFMQAVRSASS